MRGSSIHTVRAEMVGAVTTSVTVIAVFVALASWVLFWGAMSAVVLANRCRVNRYAFVLGLLGPVGPAIALTIVLAARSGGTDELP